jgi:mono/diheme cytochrome c family protein
MSAPANQSSSVVPAAAEPSVARCPVPVWVFIVLVLVLYWAMVYFDLHSGWFSPQVYYPYTSVAELEILKPRSLGPFDEQRGKAVFEQNCALCHNSDGTGKPGQGPPFVGSEWVLGSANRMIRIPQSGLTGPIQVKGQEYNLSMAPMGAGLSDEDLANVLSYIRTSWGNKGSIITKEQVQAVRKEVGNRSQPWTGPELMNVPEK